MMSDANGIGAGIGAFFDLDNTLLRVSSGRLFLRHLLTSQTLGLDQWATLVRAAARYSLGRIDFPRLMALLVVSVGRLDEAQLWAMSSAWRKDVIPRFVADQGRKQVEWHLAQGHHVVIASASMPYAVLPVASHLGLGHRFIATELEAINGRFTGGCVEPVCFGPGKLARAQAYATEHSLSLQDSYFYSDSVDDLPLLEAVAHPVAVNPSKGLRKIALQRSWPVVYFH